MRSALPFILLLLIWCRGGSFGERRAGDGRILGTDRPQTFFFLALPSIHPSALQSGGVRQCKIKTCENGSLFLFFFFFVPCRPSASALPFLRLVYKPAVSSQRRWLSQSGTKGPIPAVVVVVVVTERRQQLIHSIAPSTTNSLGSHSSPLGRPTTYAP